MHRFSGIDNRKRRSAIMARFDPYCLWRGHTGLCAAELETGGSSFRGREPDQFRYNIETGPLDSASIAPLYNPTSNWAMQVSYGHIKSPKLWSRM
jgi:hypothetical protein